MLAQRSSGILLHPTSLPSAGGIGDFGAAAYSFVDWLAAAKQTSWQVLPLQPVGSGNSPYSCTSAFAGNVLMISLERLAERGLLDPQAVAAIPDGESAVDYATVRANKIPLLRKAARNFLRSASGSHRERYDQFCREHQWWLDDYVLFNTLREKFHRRPWNVWPKEIARRDPETIARLNSELHDRLEERRFWQFAFFEQWRALRSYCTERGIRVIGDVAIFVSYDSADVWTHPELFRLKEDLLPEVVAGVPPDAFSETGQRWGNPLYDWDALRARWLRLVDQAHELGDRHLRHRSPRSLSRLRSVLGDSGRRADRGPRTLGRGAERGSVRRLEERAGQAAFHCRGSGLHHSGSASICARAWKFPA